MQTIGKAGPLTAQGLAQAAEIAGAGARHGLGDKAEIDDALLAVQRASLTSSPEPVS